MSHPTGTSGGTVNHHELPRTPVFFCEPPRQHQRKTPLLIKQTLRHDVKRLRSDLNETASNDAASTATTTGGTKDSTTKGVTKGVTKGTANLERLLGVSSAPAGASSSPVTAVTDAPAVAPKSVTGSSEDSTTGLFGEMSVSARDASADGTAAPEGASPNSVGGGGRRTDGGMVSVPPAKRHRSAAAAEVGGSVGDSAGAEGAVIMGETELREQLTRQNRLLAEMAKELEGLRKERSGGAVGNGGGGVGGIGEGSAVLPVRAGGLCLAGAVGMDMRWTATRTSPFH